MKVIKNVISAVAGIAIAVGLIMATLIPIADYGYNTATNTMDYMEELDDAIADFVNKNQAN